MEKKTENHFFELVRLGRRITPWWAVIVLGLAFLFVGQFPGGILYFLWEAGWSDKIGDLSPVLEGGVQTLLLIALYLPIALLVWGWVAIYEKRPFWTLGLEKVGALWKYGRGVLVGVAMFVAVVGLLLIPGYVAPEQGDAGMQGMAALGGVLIAYIGWTIQGPIEELLTRGWMFQAIGVRIRPWVGVLITALLFSAMHLFNASFGWIPALNIFLVGLFYALFVLWEEGLWGVCGMHAAWNWVQGNGFGFEVSGNNPQGGSLRIT
jgi:membrane protease YdiL (CAAX protease family)